MDFSNPAIQTPGMTNAYRGLEFRTGILPQGILPMPGRNAYKCGAARARQRQFRRLKWI
jgi:hypothetical protein